MMRKYMAVIAVVILLVSGTSFCQRADDDIWDDTSENDSNQVEITKETAEQILKQLDKTQPGRAKQLRQLRETDPVRYAIEIRQIAQRKVNEETKDGKTSKTTRPADKTRTNRWLEYAQKRIEEYMTWLEKNIPAEARRLNILRDKDPEGFVNEVSVSRRKYEALMRAQKKNPELAEVLKKDIELLDARDLILKELLTAKESEREKLIEDLSVIVSARFDIIIEKKHLKYKELEEKIDQMRKDVNLQKRELQNLKAKKAQTTKQRVDELLEEIKKISWK